MRRLVLPEARAYLLEVEREWLRVSTGGGPLEGPVAVELRWYRAARRGEVA